MPKTKQASKRTRRKEAVPVLGLVGVSLSLAGGASTANAAVADNPSQDRVPLPGREITLNEEEISDVSLGTFYVFDKEDAGTSRVQLARGCRCGGCGGCRGCRGCHRGCRGCGGCGGCGCGGCGCCWLWGFCRVC
jgi:hypothetical protein